MIKKNILIFLFTAFIFTACSDISIKKGNSLEIDPVTSPSSISSDIVENSSVENLTINKNVNINDLKIKFPETWEVMDISLKDNGVINICDPNVNKNEIFYTNLEISRTENEYRKTVYDLLDDFTPSYLPHETPLRDTLASEIVNINGLECVKIKLKVLGTMEYEIWVEDIRELIVFIPLDNYTYRFCFTYRSSNLGEDELMSRIANTICLAN